MEHGPSIQILVIREVRTLPGIVLVQLRQESPQNEVTETEPSLKSHP